ncbi:hypothetical protein INR49_005995 [Caranx melampygus]|nr:hypothetical protein INR49_005995 [Caranx melampygus]
MPSSIPVPQYQHWPSSRGESMRPMDPRRGPPRSYLPRGISWPSPCYAPFPPREGDGYRQPDRMMEGEGRLRSARSERSEREGGPVMPVRAAVGAVLASSDTPCPSLPHSSVLLKPQKRMSATDLKWSCLRGERKGEEPPHLDSNSKTLECLHGRGILLHCKITFIELFLSPLCHNCYLTTCSVYLIRRNTSVDESYEWDSADACVDSEVLEAMKFDQSHMSSRRGRVELRCDQARGLQDQHQKAHLPQSVSPPVSNPPRCQYGRSLSEARFDALRQEYQEYRRAQESICSHEPCRTPGHDSDSDSNSALL